MAVRRRARNSLLIVLALVVAMLAAACGGIEVSSDEGGSTTPIPRRSASDLATVRAGSSAPTATPAPTRVPPTPTPTVPAPPTATPRNEADTLLATALLTHDDLGPAWTDADAIDPRAYCNLPRLDEAFPPVARASASWVNSGGGYLIEWLFRMPAENALPAMEHARQMLACETFQVIQDDGDVLDWTFTETTIPPLGDEAVARSVSLVNANPAFAPMAGAIATIRSGDVVAVLLYMGVAGGSSDPQAVALADTIAYQVVARMEQVRAVVP